MLALSFAEPAEVELVVVAQEHAPLRRRGPRLGRLQRLLTSGRVSAVASA